MYYFEYVFYFNKITFFFNSNIRLKGYAIINKDNSV